MAEQPKHQTTKKEPGLTTSGPAAGEGRMVGETAVGDGGRALMEKVANIRVESELACEEAQRPVDAVVHALQRAAEGGSMMEVVKVINHHCPKDKDEAAGFVAYLDRFRKAADRAHQIAYELVITRP